MKAKWAKNYDRLIKLMGKMKGKQMRAKWFVMRFTNFSLIPKVQSGPFFKRDAEREAGKLNKNLPHGAPFEWWPYRESSARTKDPVGIHVLNEVHKTKRRIWHGTDNR